MLSKQREYTYTPAELIEATRRYVRAQFPYLDAGDVIGRALLTITQDNLSLGALRNAATWAALNENRHRRQERDLLNRAGHDWLVMSQPGDDVLVPYDLPDKDIWNEVQRKRRAGVEVDPETLRKARAYHAAYVRRRRREKAAKH